MNLWYSSLAMLFSITIVYSATLTGAYNAYLHGSYQESLDSYRSVYKETKNRDALYGVINSLVALERFDEALTLSREESDPILTAKEVWILGLMDKKKEARDITAISQRTLTPTQNAVIYQSGGVGFQTEGNYKEAILWFEKSYQYNPTATTKAMLDHTKKLKKEAVLWSGTIGGGPIIYSKSPITERNVTYRYNSGYFLDIGARWDIKKQHTFEAVYSRFDATFQENTTTTDYFYGINYESELYHSLDTDAGWPWAGQYSVYDSLNNWENSNEKINKYVQLTLDSIRDTITGETYRPDTAYTLYEEYFLGSSDTGSYDTTVSVSTKETTTPAPIFQNNLYLGYTQWYIGGRNLHLGLAANLLNSNIKGMNTGITLYGYHGHLTRNKYLLFNGNWYGTFTDQISVLQASPELTAFFGPKVSLRITPTYTWKANAPYIYNMPGIQLSCESALHFTTETLSLGGSVTVGKRAFVAESAGKHVVNITLPHKATGTLSFSVTPGKKSVTLFAMGRYESYEQMSRLVAMGGLTVTL